MATKKPTPKGFEKSVRDIERGGMKEGSKREEAFDRKQAKPSKAFVKEMQHMYPKGATISPAKKKGK